MGGRGSNLVRGDGGRLETLTTRSLRHRGGYALTGTADFSEVVNPATKGHISSCDAGPDLSAMTSFFLTNSPSSTKAAFDVPQLIAPTTFRLDDPLHNRTIRLPFLVGTREVLEETADYKLILVGNRGFGKIGLIQKSDDWLAYYVQYELEDTFVGRSVTQVSLWRDDTSPFVQGITVKMFHEILLERFRIIMSDGQQTPDGRSFWIRRMVDAAGRGLKVGLANIGTGTIDWYDPATSIQGWVRNAKAWGADPQLANLRFVIAKD